MFILRKVQNKTKIKMTKIACVFLCLAVVSSIAHSSLLTALDESHCMTDKQTLPAQPAVQLVVTHLNDTVVSALNTNFKEKFNCLYHVFTQSLAEMGQTYQDISVNGDAAFVEQQNKTVSAKKSDKKKSKKVKVPENFLGQVGFFAYTINQNHTVGLLKHESVKYMRPVNETVQANIESADAELWSYRNEINVLKKLLSHLKTQEKAVLKKLKAVLKKDKLKQEYDE